jgi:uncharacterized membrane protein YwaF
MAARQKLYRRFLVISAVLLVAVALALAVVVIPQVRAEAARGGTPEMAVTAFWLNVGFTLVSALALLAIGARSQAATGFARLVLVIVGLVVLFLGISCIDAAFAYISHDPAMRSGSILLFVCGPIDLLVGLGAIAVAFLTPRASAARAPGSGG